MGRDLLISGLIGLGLVGGLGVASEAKASTRYLAFDAKDRTTEALTRGVTLEVERGLFGAVAVRNLFSTTSRGSAQFERGGPDGVRRSLPEGASESGVYRIKMEGDGRGLARALCPGAQEAWLVAGKVRVARPLTLHAVGLWPDGKFRHCVQLNYEYRGEWALPRGAGSSGDERLPGGPG